MIISKKKDSQLFAILSFFVILLAYHQPIINCYGFVDDYRHLYRAITHDKYFPYNIIVQGRPLYAFLLDLAMNMAGNICNLRFVRLVALIFIWIFSIFIFCTLKSYPKFDRFLLPLLIILLPPFQIIAGWAATFQLPIAAIAAYLAADRALQHKKISAIILLLISLMLYQTASCFFFVYFMTKNARPRFFPFIAASIIFLAIHQLIKYFFISSDAFYLRAASRSQINTDIFDKIIWFLKGPLIDSANLYLVPPNIWMAIIIGLLVCFAAIKERKILEMPIYIALSFLPSLILKENSGVYRAQLCLSVVILFYIYYAIRYIPSYRVILSITLVVSIYLANHNLLKYIIKPQIREIEFVKNELKSENINVTELEKIKSPMIYHEFGDITLSHSWTIEGMLFLVKHEKHYDNP